MPPMRSATPNHAVTAAYSPRISGPSARAMITPPRAAAAVETPLKPAVRATGARCRAASAALSGAPPPFHSTGCDLRGHSSLRTASCAYRSGTNAVLVHWAACLPIRANLAGSLSKSFRVLASASADSSAGATPVTPST